MKLSTKKTRLMLFTLLLSCLQCLASCMRSRERADTEKPLQLKPSKEDAPKDDSTFSVITNLFLDSSKKESRPKPALSKLPFKHIGFYEAAAMGEQRFKWRAKILQTSRDMDELKQLFPSQQLADSYQDFKGNTIITLLHTSSRTNSAIRISQLKRDDRIHILAELLHTKSNCETLAGPESSHHLHMIAVPANLIPANKNIRVDLMRTYEACAPSLPWKQETYMRVPFKQIHYEEQSKKPWDYPSPRILPFTNNWGEWGIFKQNYCNLCDQLGLPGPANHYGYIAVVEGKAWPQAYGKSHLLIDKLYRNAHHVGLGLKRIVELCEVSEANHPMILLEIDKRSLRNEEAFIKSHSFRLPSAFIPEDHVACGSFTKTR